MRKKLLTFIMMLLACVSIFSFGLAGCGGSDSNTYELQTNGDNVLIYQSTFDFDEYFADAYILKTTQSGEEFFIPLTVDMLSSAIDTSSVGEKSVKINYASQQFTFSYSVKYKVEFLVDSQVFDTQLVFDATQLDFSKEPTKEGFEFTGWENQPQEILGNLQINATFAKAVSAPQLQTLNAQFGDTLQSLTLPSNEFGAWQFVDELTQTVGAVGTQEKAVKFVLNDGQVFTTDTVNVEVSQKTLQFKFDCLSFEYDGLTKEPNYYFDSVDKEQVNVIYVAHQENAVNVGEYDFELIIDDENYQGEYSGRFTIVKKPVKIKVNHCQMTYLEEVPNGSFVVTDINGQSISQSLIDELGVELDLPFFSPLVGEYEIGIKEKTYDNFEVSVEKGVLTVNKAVHAVDAIPNAEQVVYGNALSDVELSSSILGIGEWAWVDESIVLSQMTGVSALARFTPNDQANYEIIEKEVALTVLKRRVEIRITQNQFVYNAQPQALKYSVLGILSGDEDEFSVLGNTQQINAGTYHLTLTLQSNKYQAQNVDGRLIIDKANGADFASLQEQLGLITYDKNNASKLSHLDLPKGYTWKDSSLSLLIGENTCQVVFTPEDQSNFNVEQGEIKLIVEKGTSIITINKNQFIYNHENAYDFVASLNHDEVQLQYEFIYNGEKVDQLKDAGEYEIIITCAEGQLYKGATERFNVEILAVENLDAVPQTINATYLDTLSKYLQHLPTNAKGNWTWQEDLSTQVGSVGKQVHKAVFTPNDTLNYKSRVVDVEFNVAKKVVEVPQINSKVEYTGKEQVFATAGEYYSVSNEKATDIGEYNVVFTLNDSANFKWANSEEESIEITVKIVENENVWIVAPTLSKTTWTYKEEGAVLNEYKSKFGSASVRYEGIDNQYNGQEMPTNAGKYKVIIAVGGAEYYSSLTESIEFTIEKIGVRLPQAPASKVYTGERLIADLEQSDLYTAQNNGGVDAGDYEVKLTLKDSVNYMWLDTNDSSVRTLTFTIMKVDNEWLGEVKEIAESKIISYGESLELKAKYGDIRVNAVGINGTEFNAQEMPTNAGSYQINLTVDESTNFAGLLKTFELTIKPLQLVITAPVYKDIVFYENVVNPADESNMQTQPALNLQTAGEFSYKIELGQVITNGVVQVSISFVPNDSVNFITPLEVYAPINVKAVAKIGENTYGSIESALSASSSGDEIWVLAGEKDAVIASNCTIPNGVTLNIPHTADSMNSDGTAVLNGQHSTPTITVTTVITINAGVTLTNNGTLKVAGELSGGGGGHSYAGHTAGKSAKILMKAGSKINNVGGTINLFGIIIEEEDNNGSEVIVDGGNLCLPYVVRDFRGGTYMSNIYTKATAFNEFEIRNITSFVTIKNSANVYGYANLYAGSQHNVTTVSLVSTTNSAVVHLSQGAYLTFKYNIVGGYQNNDAWIDGVMDIRIFGGATADPMSLKVKYIFEVTVSTKDVFFPLSWRLNVSLYDGDYTMAYKYKLMPGAVFTVGAGANLTINHLAVYDEAAYNAAYESALKGTPAPHYNIVKALQEERTYHRGDAQFIIENGATVTIGKKNSSGGIDAGFVGGNITKKEGATFNYQKESTKYYCEDCKAYYDTKCTKKNWLIFTHTSREEVTSLITVKSPEGTSDSGGTYDIVLELTINGKKP